MMNKLKEKNRLILFLLLMLSTLVSGWSTTDPLQEIQTKFDAYKKRNSPVKIDLVFSQPIYAPGDTAFFSVWYHDEKFTPVKGDHIITLELYAPDERLSQRIHFKVHNGRGINQLIFNQNLSGGEYQLLVYSDWMKNFGMSWFCRKSITVTSDKQGIGSVKPKPLIRFYPEGGNLVEDIMNKVVVLGPPSQEFKIQSLDSPETKVRMDSTGMGVFEITPKLNKKYFIESADGNRYVLPEVKAGSLSVRFEEHKGESFVEILVSPNTAMGEKGIYAIITSRGEIVMKQKVEITEGSNYQIKMPGGSNALHQIFVFNAEGRILSERIFIPHSESGIKVKIELPAVSNQREPVPYKVTVSDTKGNSLKSDIAISILQEDLFKDFSILNNFNLSDLPEASEHYEKLEDKLSMNDYLITQKWERIDWNSIWEEKYPKQIFPFQSTLKLKGKIISKESGVAPPDSTLVIGYLQENIAGYEAYTKNGYFEILFAYDFFGEDQIFCTAQYKSKNIDSKYIISVDLDSVDANSKSIHSVNSVPPLAYTKYIEAKRLVTNSFSFFGKDQAKSLSTSQNRNVLFEEEFMGADQSINLSDYVAFSSMKDVVHEIIPFVKYYSKGDKEWIRMVFKYAERTKIYADDPLYVVDGVMSRSTPFFLGIKPQDVISIKIINNPNKLAQLGKLGANGVILVETKTDELAMRLLRENHFSIIGLSYPIDAISLAKRNPPLRYPDLRSTLYWNPQLKNDTDAPGTDVFNTSDDIGRMRMSIQGLTEDHQYFSFEQSINVKYNPSKK